MKIRIILFLSAMVISFSLSGQGSRKINQDSYITGTPVSRKGMVVFRDAYYGSDKPDKDYYSDMTATEVVDPNMGSESQSAPELDRKIAGIIKSVQDFQRFYGRREQNFLIKPNTKGGKLIIIKPDTTVTYYLKVIKPGIYRIPWK